MLTKTQRLCIQQGDMCTQVKILASKVDQLMYATLRYKALYKDGILEPRDSVQYKYTIVALSGGGSAIENKLRHVTSFDKINKIAEMELRALSKQLNEAKVLKRAAVDAVLTHRKYERVAKTVTVIAVVTIVAITINVAFFVGKYYG